MLQIVDLVKSYETATRTVPVLRGVSLDLEAGTSLALMGESGSGKSTLLHLVAGLDQPSSGEITLEGVRLTQSGDRARAALRRSAIGIVFQHFNLVPSLSVARNIAFQAQLAGRHDPAWCAELAERMGLSAQLQKYPEALSGGQQQRVAIARALAVRPRLLLADEPTGNLDEDTAAQVLTGMLEIARETGTALLMVTHSPLHAARLDRRVLLRAGQIQ